MTRDEAFEVSRRAVERFDKGRNLQWKFNVSVWTLLVVGTYFFEKENIQLDKWFVWVFSILFFLTHTVFVVMIQLSLAGSVEVERHIYKCLNKTIDSNADIHVNIEKLSRKSSINSKGCLWLLFQLMTTVLFLSLFIFLNTN